MGFFSGAGSICRPGPVLKTAYSCQAITTWIVQKRGEPRAPRSQQYVSAELSPFATGSKVHLAVITVEAGTEIMCCTAQRVIRPTLVQPRRGHIQVAVVNVELPLVVNPWGSSLVSWRLGKERRSHKRGKGHGRENYFHYLIS